MEFDKLVHQPTRLQIFAYLYRHEQATFSELQSELEITDGNLSAHVQRMEDADAATVEKRFVDRRPQTTYELTDEGRTLFESHVDTLETLLDQLEHDGTGAGDETD
ncbi:winged helix-turn-helix domain-containing protein [Natronolimnohabitans innermongolicus]|uniref:Transcriptional regulator n=1 Tax=Natronolimnohabitans innermongolicus JCM 12255 TaxID=1227499 RepID=L9XJH7_9EURY|nr:transcriptional regulator [Natronolimnohabitans innermongolicus]ELY61914.1 transcriptional regulator [Natronolimnohabitans innermongolicus JCM 12255]